MAQNRASRNFHIDKVFTTLELIGGRDCTDPNLYRPDLIVWGGVSVGKTSCFAGDLVVKQDVMVDGNLNVIGNTYLNQVMADTITVDNLVTDLITVGPNDTLTIKGNVDILGNLFISSGNVTAGVASFSAGSTGLTPVSPATGAVVLGGILAPANGGTGLDVTGASAGELLIANGSGGLSLNALSAGPGVTITNGSGTITIGASSGGGTVTSVGLGLPGIFTVTGSPVTTSGTLSAVFASQVANTVFAAPNGASGVPTFRMLVAGDLPLIPLATGVTGVLPAADGGTGVNGASAANGQLLIGNGTGFSLQTLTAGTAITITNGSGTITVANNGVSSWSGGTTGMTPNSAANGAVVLGGVLNPANGGTGVNNGTSTITLGGSLTTFGAFPISITATGPTNVTVPTTGTLLTSADAVTSVGLALPSIFTISNSPVTTTGTLTAVFANEPANTVLAAPNGSSGVPSFRALVSADLPPINLSNVTGILSPTNGGTGVNASSATNGQLFIGNGSGLSLNTLNAGSGVTITNGSGTITISATGAGGTVTSVGLALPSMFTVSGSPVTSSGTLTATLASEAANTVLAAPNGSTGIPTFRMLVAGDIPLIPLASGVTGVLPPLNGGTGVNASSAANGQILIGNGSGLSLNTLTAGSGVSITDGSGTITISATGSGGTVTSVGLSLPSIFTVMNSPVTSSGTLQAYFNSESANTVFAAPNGSSGTPTFRTLVAADIPAINLATGVIGILPAANGGTGLNTSGATNGQLLIGNGSGLSLSTITGGTAITVTNGPGTISIANNGVTSWSAGITGFTPSTAANGAVVMAGVLNASSGGTGVNNGSNTITLGGSIVTGGTFTTSGSNALTITTTGPTNVTVPTSGTLLTSADAVTSVGLALPSIFTVTGTPVTTTGTLTATFNSQVANTVFAAPNGSAGTPSFRTLVAADIPTISLATGVSGVLPAANGGTGVNASAAANGQLLIGNGSGFSLNTITASTAITVTNGAGTITIANNGVTSWSGGTTGLTPNIASIGAVVLGGVLNAASGGTGVNNGSNTITLGGSLMTGGSFTTSGTSALTITTTGPTNVTFPTTGTLLTSADAVTSVGLALPSIFIVSGSPVTTTGTLTATLASESANTVFAAPNGVSGTPVFRSLIAADIPLISLTSGVSGILPTTCGGTGLDTAAAANGQLLIGDGSGFSLNTLTAGTNVTITNGAGSIIIAASGSVSSVGLALPSIFSVSNSPVTSTGTLTAVLASESANTVFAAPNGSAGIPTFRSLVAADIPAISLTTGVMGVLPAANGGTGINTSGATNGQLLIGNGSGLSLNTLTAGTGISVTNGSGTITVANAGVVTFSGGTTGLTPSTPTAGAIVLGGTLAVANGGTGNNAPLVAGGVAYGISSTMLGTSAVGTSGQLLMSGGVSSPAWTSSPTLSSLTISSGGDIYVSGGGTLTGLPTTPVNSTDAASKAYVDANASGLNYKPTVMYATTAALPSNTYNNGSSGVGATITANAAGVLTVDGAAITTVGTRILVKNEANQADNGIYQVTTVGTASVPFVLTRTTDANTSAELNNAAVYVTSGTVNVGASFVQTTPSPTLGTSPVVWTQFSGNATYSAGTGLNLSGNQFSLMTPVANANGGTGLNTASAANGQLLIGTGTGFALNSLTAGSNVTVTNGSGTITIAATGSVYSVGLALPSIFTVSGSPVTSTGTLTAVLATESANTVFAAPNGSSGTPTFRALVAADIPAISLTTGVTGVLPPANGGTGINTSGATNGELLIGTGSGLALNTLTAGSNVTVTNGSGTITIAATGSVYSVGLALPSIFTVSNSPVTSTGTLTATLASESANTVFAAPNGSSGTPTFRALVAGDIPLISLTSGVTGILPAINGGTGLDASAAANGQLLIGNGSGLSLSPLTAGSGVTITNGSGSIMISATGSGGTVTSVGLALPSIFTVSGSPVTSTGTLTAVLANETANTVFAAPNGSTGTPTFRALVAADIPTISLTTGVSGVLPAANGGTGINTSSASNGELLIGNGAGLSLNTLTAGSNVTITNGSGTITIAAAGSVTSVALALPNIFTVTGSPVTSSGTLTATLASESANTVFAAPNGTAGTPTFRALVAADIPTISLTTGVSGILPAANGGTGINTSGATNGEVLIGNGSGLSLHTLTAGTGVTITNGSGTITIAATGTGGTVTSVGLALPSIFTVSGSPVTTTGTLTATLANETANTVFAAPNGSTGTPTFRTLVAADIPTISLTTGVSGVLPAANGGTGINTSTATNGELLIGNGAGLSLNTLTAGSNVSITNGSGTITIASTGSVSSVGLIMPSIFTVSNSPITGSGTMHGFADQRKCQHIFCGPQWIFRHTGISRAGSCRYSSH